MVRARLLPLALLGATLAGACFTGSDGLFPPPKGLYFPTAIAVSPGRTALYVANSDFDLQYNGGTVQVVNLADHEGQPGLRTQAEAVAGAIASGLALDDICGAAGLKPNQEELLHPGPCEPLAYARYVRGFATVGAFTSGMSLVPRPDAAGMRLFVTVRGDPSVTFFDVTDDRDPVAPSSPCGEAFCLDCDQSGEEKRCSVGHRIGESAVASIRGINMPTEPAGIAAAPLPGGDALVIAHPTEASASLVVNRWTGASALPWPTLEFTLKSLADDPFFVVAIPPPAVVEAAADNIAYRPGFILSHRSAPALSVVRFEDDRGSAPPRPFLILAGQPTVTLQGEVADSRGMAVDASAREACEGLFAPTDVVNLAGCARDNPVRFYVASRSPASLLGGTIETEIALSGDVVTSVDERLSLDDVVPLSIGASNVAVGHVIGLGGELEVRIFVVSFDARALAIYDPVLRRVEKQVRTGRGPAGIAFDTGVDAGGALRSHLYVAHFTDSYLGIVDLDARRPTYGEVVVSVGPPEPPREEQ